MAEFYIDISAVGQEYQAYADTPTSWGVPQDGDGRAGPGHAAAVAVATIDVAGCSASGTGTIGVLGVTVSSTLNASGAALATAIAAAINAATGATTASFCQLLLPLNRLVFARVNPGLSTQVQIMLRIAGAGWNAVAPTQANVSPAATIAAFSGGAAGPFGYLISGSTLFGKATGLYGAWCAASAGPVEPGLLDCVHARTRRSGAGLAATLNITSGAFNWPARNYLYDDGTVWSGDDGSLVFTLLNTNSGTANVRFIGPSTRVAHHSRKFGGLEFKVGTTLGNFGSVAMCYPSPGGAFAFTNSIFSEHTTNIGGMYAILENSSQNTTADFSDSMFRFNSTAKVALSWVASNYAVRANLNGLKVEVVAATGAIGPILAMAFTGQACQVMWTGGRVYDTNGAFRCVNPFSITTSNTMVEATVDGVAGVTNPSVGWTSTSLTAPAKFIWSMPQGPDRGFRYETPTVSVDWKGDGTFPHCGAESFQADPWSHRVTWKTLITSGLAQMPLRLGFGYRSATAVRTITLQMFVPNASTLYLDEVEFAVNYVDTSDVWRTETVGGNRPLQYTSGRVALDSSAKSWTANGVAAHSAKKINLTTAYAVKQGTEIVARLSLAATKSPAVTLYVSPALEVA